MPQWPKLLITFVALLATSFVAWLAWKWVFNSDIPIVYLGIVGGFTAAAAWALLERFGPK